MVIIFSLNHLRLLLHLHHLLLLLDQLLCSSICSSLYVWFVLIRAVNTGQDTCVVIVHRHNLIKARYEHFSPVSLFFLALFLTWSRRSSSRVGCVCCCCVEPLLFFLLLLHYYLPHLRQIIKKRFSVWIFIRHSRLFRLLSNRLFPRKPRHSRCFTFRLWLWITQRQRLRL